MRFSRKSEYALRALVAMARLNRSVQIGELARLENIPVKFLEQVLIALRHGGLLTSKRGVGGGYVLRLDPSTITVRSVIELMDGPIAPLPCAADRPREQCTCPDPRACPIRQLMVEVREQMSAGLESRTIDDLVRLGAKRAALAFDI